MGHSKSHFFTERTLSPAATIREAGEHTLLTQFLFGSPAAGTTVLFFGTTPLLYDPVYEVIKVCPQQYFRTPQRPTHLHCLINASAGTPISAWARYARYVQSRLLELFCGDRRQTHPF